MPVTEQRVYFINVDGYICFVPHVFEDEYIFLKSVIHNKRQPRAVIRNTVNGNRFMVIHKLEMKKKDRY